MIIHNSNLVNNGQAAPAPAPREITIEVTRPESQTQTAQEEEVRGEEQTRGTEGTERSQDDEARRREALARREAQRENVIARSEDGDTLQVERQNADIEDEDIGEVVMRQGQMDALQAGSSEMPESSSEEEDFEISGTDRIFMEQNPPGQAPVREEAALQAMATVNEPTEQMQVSEEDSTEDTSLEEEDVVGQILDESVERAAELEAQTAAAELRSEDAEELEEERERTRAAVEEAVSSRDAEQNFAAQTSSNYVGISDDRLEQMYLQGEISRQDYEAEIEAREAAREQTNEENTEFSREMNDLEGIERQTEQNGDAIRSATSDNANNTLTAEQRLDIIEDLQDARATDDNRKEEARKVWQSQFQG